MPYRTILIILNIDTILQFVIPRTPHYSTNHTYLLNNYYFLKKTLKYFFEHDCTLKCVFSAKQGRLCVQFVWILSFLSALTFYCCFWVKQCSCWSSQLSFCALCDVASVLQSSLMTIVYYIFNEFELKSLEFWCSVPHFKVKVRPLFWKHQQEVVFVYCDFTHWVNFTAVCIQVCLDIVCRTACFRLGYPQFLPNKKRRIARRSGGILSAPPSLRTVQPCRPWVNNADQQAAAAVVWTTFTQMERRLVLLLWGGMLEGTLLSAGIERCLQV